MVRIQEQQNLFDTKRKVEIAFFEMKCYMNAKRPLFVLFKALKIAKQRNHYDLLPKLSRY